MPWLFNHQKLTELREQKGVTSEMLAVHIGKTRNTIRNWELNKTIPTAEDLCLLADYFGFPPTHFFTCEITKRKGTSHA